MTDPDRRAFEPDGPAPAGAGRWAPGSAAGLGRALAYVTGYLALDWLSYIHPWQGMNITPWNPQPAVAIALLVRGRHGGALALVWAMLVAAEILVRGMPAGAMPTALSAAALTLGYAAVARVMSQRVDLSRVFSSTRQLLGFALAIVAGALACGLLYLGTLRALAAGADGAFVEAVARYWVGDAVGCLVALPLLLMLADRRRRAALSCALRSPAWWFAAATMVAVSWFVLARPEPDQFRYFYLLFLPVGLAAARLGAAGAAAAAALTQACLIVGVVSVPRLEFTVFELQGLMAAIAATGLVLGVLVDERERVATELRASLGMAAAGEMAAALAHELNQPLTALGSYAEAARIIADDRERPEAETRALLADVALRMSADAGRAADVVKRLRDFFRSGATQLRTTGVARLLDDAIEQNRRRADAAGVSLGADCPEGLPAVRVDPVQVSVVLRNLVGNAIEAAARPGGGRVQLSAEARGPELRLSVIDDGPGLRSTELERPFEPRPSGKPGGMGIGLGLSRAIVEAHGGRLWAEPGPGGRFTLSLPIRDEGEGEEEGGDAS